MRLVCKSSIFIILFSALFFSCVISKNNHKITEKEELWQVYDFNNTRITLQAPKGIRWTESFYENDPSLYIELSPVKPPKGIIDDTFYRVKIVVKRTTEKALEMEKERFFRSNLYKNSDDLGKKKWLWKFEIHKKIDWISDGKYQYYRKDVPLSKSSLLSAHAEVLYVDEKDEILVTNILNSIEPLPVNR
jgi:hypothetical protein